eukprot:2733270-Amphidinium_carterae.1
MQPLHLCWRWDNVAFIDGKPSFELLLGEWLSSAPRPGGALLVIEQPWLPRYRVQLRSAFNSTPGFQSQIITAMGHEAPAVFFSHSGNILDPVAHWTAACTAFECPHA